MKNILLFILFTTTCFAQVTQEWVSRYAGPGNSYDIATAMIVDGSNNVYVAGESNSSSNISSFVTIKYNASGDTLWKRSYTVPVVNAGGATAIAVDASGNVYVTGGSFTTIKYDATGVQQWLVQYWPGGNTGLQARDIAVDNQGNVYVTGGGRGNTSTDDYVTIKYNPSGEPLWVQIYNGPGNDIDFASSMEIDAVGNVFVTGRSWDSGNSFDYATIKYNSSGTQQWVTRYHYISSDQAADITIDASGNLYVTGFSADANTFSDYATIKYNSSGTQEWVVRYNGPADNHDAARAIALGATGDIYVTGRSQGPSTNFDFATIKYNNSGETVWVQRYNGPTNSEDAGISIALDNNENVYVTGVSFGSGTLNDYATIKYNVSGDTVWIRRYNGPANNVDQVYAIDVDLLNNVYVTGGSTGVGTGYDFATIKYSQGITITEPQAGEKWIAGETDTIRWTGGQAGRFLKVEYSTNNGQTYVQIDANAPADSNYYIWKIPGGVLTTKAKIRITDVIYPEDSAVSNTFKIKGYILTRKNNSGNYDPYTKFRDPYSFGNDSASVWPIEFWQNFDYTGTDPFTGYNYLLGFPYFFLQSNSSDHPDWVSWVRTFGVSACYYNTSFPPVYSPTAVNRWFNNRDEWAGSCFGISHSNVLLFNHKTQFLNTYPSFPNVNPLKIIPDDSVLTVINELFTHQMGREHRIYRATVGLLKTPNQTLSEIKAMLLDDDPLIRTLSIRSNDTTDPGGHSIMAYKVEQDTTLSNIFYIFTYDNSYPNNLDSAIIVVDTLANNNNGTWTPIYAWTNWGGTKWFYLREPAINYLVNPSLPKNKAAVSPFILDENELQILNARNASISITDQQGNKSGYIDGILLNNIPGSIPNIIENGSSGPPIGYDLPTENYSIQMKDYKDQNAFISFYNSNKSFMVSRSTVQNTDNDRYYFDGGLSVTNPDQQLKNINLLNILNETTQEKVFFINELELAQADSVKIFNSDDNTLDLISYGSAKEYQLELNLASSSGLGRFKNSTIQLSQNTTHKIVPNWADINNSSLTILVDEGNEGTIDDTLEIENQVTGIGEDQGLLLTPNNYNLAQNYPNPFNPVTTIQYSIPQRSNVTLKVYDILGNEVATLVNEEKDRGVYSVNFDASHLASGMYLYRLQAGSFIETKKMILIK
jgi:hypothetical protein